MCGHLQLNILAYAKADPQGHASKVAPILAIMIQWTLRGLSNVETPTSLGHVGRHWDLQPLITAEGFHVHFRLLKHRPEAISASEQKENKRDDVFDHRTLNPVDILPLWRAARGSEG